MSMFCYQCEQTAKGTGCTAAGVCGKDETVARLQDLLVEQTRRLGGLLHRADGAAARDAGLNRFLLEALFSTVTNVDFDPDRIEGLLKESEQALKKAQTAYEKAGKGPVPANLAPLSLAPDRAGKVRQAEAFGVEARRKKLGDDRAGLQDLLLFGLKGMAAYADHARILGQEDPAVYAFFHEVLDYLTHPEPSVDQLTGLCLKTGEVNLKVMGLLDAGNTGLFGHPEPTQVRVTPLAGKAILVSGHDLKDLKMLLEQTEGKGVKVYTHGEMLPCLAYPELKKHKHLAGNYGGAWQDQRKEFEAFPGAILMTTNCIQKPKETYIGRIFSTGLVAWPGVMHTPAALQGQKNFGPVIDAALAAPGFAEDGEEKTILTGFGHAAVLGVAGAVIDAVKAGQIRHFFLIGGCDGAKPGRNYYTELAKQVPQDCVILTLACGKFRFNKLDFGDIGGIPRLLDIGQCNDSYSAIKIALALADAFGTDVNGLPLSMILSWYEQKAVCILLTLLHLGVKNIRLGPSLPAFITEPVLNVLVENYGLAPITTPEEDLKAILG